MAATHDNLILLNVLLTAAATETANFGNCLYIVDGAGTAALEAIAASATPYVTVASATEVDATDLLAATKTKVKQGFAQKLVPNLIHVGIFDSGGSGVPTSETELIDAVVAIGLDFYGVCPDTEVLATISAIATKLDALAASASAPFYAQGFYRSAAADLTTTADIFADTFPFAANRASSRNQITERGAASDTEAINLGLAAYRLAFNADQLTVAFEGVLQGFTKSTVTTTEKGIAEGNNTALLLSWGGKDYISEVKTFSGVLPGETLVTDWLATRIAEDLRAMKLAYDARGEIIPVSKLGQALVAAVVRKRCIQAVRLGKLSTPVGAQHEPFTITLPEITTADLTARRLPVSLTAYVTRASKSFTINLNAVTGG